MNKDPILKSIPLTLAVLGLFSTGVSLIFFPSFQVVGGVLLGFFLVITNFVFLTKIVAKLLDENYKGKPFLGLMFLVKLMFIGGVIYLAFWILKVNLIAFVLGYLSLLPVVLIQQFFWGTKK